MYWLSDAIYTSCEIIKTKLIAKLTSNETENEKPVTHIDTHIMRKI